MNHVNRFGLAVLGLGLLSFGACKEVPPVIPECQTQRVVLIEEYTGVKCVNCPAGSERLKQLLELHGTKLVAVSIHAGFFSVPYDNSVEDFTTTEGPRLDALTGPVTGYPAAIINRKIFANENQRPLPLNSWAGYIAAELCREPLFSLQSSLRYDSTTRRLEADIRVSPRGDVPAQNTPIGLSLMLVEDGVVSPQATLSGKVDDYTHKYILRGMLTDYTGKTILEAGQVLGEEYSESFNFTLAPHWRSDKMRLIAFVHYKGSEQMDVLQAHERALPQ